ncbi:MAG: HAD hydrolase-like protein, partial [Bacteroidota bacterium]|nr:HAD hydrolase-like protein [Bacteroidota bacterium]
MIKGLIFDLDGVLVSTETNHYAAWKLIADELKIPFTEKENEKLKGLSRADSLSALLDLGKRSISHLKFKTILDYKNKIYLKSIEKINQSNLLPGVLEF